VKQEPVYTVAIAKAKPGKEAELEKLISELVKSTHQETGCLTYRFHKSLTNPNVFIAFEKWATKEALDSHLQTPHVGKALQKKEELMESIEIIPMSGLNFGNPSKESL
jgi:quinol monooxygenase YgiN